MNKSAVAPSPDKDQALIFAAGALRVPRHAAAGPVAPVAGIALLVAIDIEPFVFVRVVADVAGLEPAAGRGDG